MEKKQIIIRIYYVKKIPIFNRKKKSKAKTNKTKRAQEKGQ